MTRKSTGSWRYRVMKHYFHRAQKFKMLATSVEQKKAWAIVESWFKDVLGFKMQNDRGVIVLPEVIVWDDDLESVCGRKQTR